ncbi:hypothetical protein Q5752_001275 [Cryptotrichosporon argae]
MPVPVWPKISTVDEAVSVALVALSTASAWVASEAASARADTAIYEGQTALELLLSGQPDDERSAIIDNAQKAPPGKSYEEMLVDAHVGAALGEACRGLVKHELLDTPATSGGTSQAAIHTSVPRSLFGASSNNVIRLAGGPHRHNHEFFEYASYDDLSTVRQWPGIAHGMNRHFARVSTGHEPALTVQALSDVVRGAAHTALVPRLEAHLMAEITRYKTAMLALPREELEQHVVAAHSETAKQSRLARQWDRPAHPAPTGTSTVSDDVVSDPLKETQKIRWNYGKIISIGASADAFNTPQFDLASSQAANVIAGRLAALGISDDQSRALEAKLRGSLVTYCQGGPASEKPPGGLRQRSTRLA